MSNTEETIPKTGIKLSPTWSSRVAGPCQDCPTSGVFCVEVVVSSALCESRHCSPTISFPIDQGRNESTAFNVLQQIITLLHLQRLYSQDHCDPKADLIILIRKSERPTYPPLPSLYRITKRGAQSQVPI